MRHMRMQTNYPSPPPVEEDSNRRMTFYLDVVQDGIKVIALRPPEYGNDYVVGIAATEYELHDLFAVAGIAAGAKGGESISVKWLGSSSLDFPEEYTDNDSVIALARRLRNSE